MRRVRITFALLMLALAGAGALLVLRALESVAAEREAQTQTLAARVFDEMERALTAFLAKEEAVPFQDWLAPRPDDPSFVLARFEIAPDGRLALSPGAPADLGPLLAGWSRERAPLPKRKTPEPAEKTFAAAEEPAAKDARQETLYEALQSLNRGAGERAQRAPKRERAEETIAASAAERRTAGPPGSGADAPRADESASADSSAGAPARAAAAPAPRPPAAAPVAPPPAATVDPLFGERLDAARLLLVRTVVEEGRGHRQGLVLEGRALGSWLRQGLLEGAPLPLAGLVVSTSDPVAAEPGRFTHRFAEPFDAVTVALSLPALPGSGSAGTVLLLSGLLVGVAGLALLALYRMVAVAMGFAEQRSNFVAAVSHELKTPLTAIRMYGEMLRDGLAPSEAKRLEYARTITAESERLSRLIDNVLEFARSERGERRAELRTGPLGEEVAAVAEMLRPHAAGAGFRLEVEVAPDLPEVRYDRDDLSQILVNLVDNAVKYARGAADRVIHLVVARSDGFVSLSVRDHGPGIPAAQLGRVFELFHRGEDEGTRTTRGTGLGLALVRSLAERMGARAAARNASGGGFEVEIRFPDAAQR